MNIQTLPAFDKPRRLFQAFLTPPADSIDPIREGVVRWVSLLSIFATMASFAVVGPALRLQLVFSAVPLLSPMFLIWKKRVNAATVLMCGMFISVCLGLVVYFQPGLQVPTALMLILTILLVTTLIHGQWALLINATLIVVTTLLTWQSGQTQYLYLPSIMTLYAISAQCYIALRGWFNAYRVTREVSEKRSIDLVRADAQLQTSNQVLAEKQRLIAQLAHEIRTPLNSIRGNMELFLLSEDAALSESIQSMLSKIDEQVTRLNQTVTNVLDTSSIENGTSRVYLELTDVRDIIAAETANFESLTVRNKLSLTLDVAPDFPAQVMTDPDKITTAISNLIRNAQKYTVAGGITIRLWTDAQCWHVSVQDTGIGIAADELAHIFEPFYQAGEKGDRRTHQGSGLGLALVKQIVVLLKGTVDVQSVPDQGSTFSIHFPHAVDVSLLKPTGSLVLPTARL